MPYIYHPPIAGTPPTPGTSGTAATIVQDFNLGWNSGAISNAVILGSGSFQFKASCPAQGIVAGLNDNNLDSNYPEINYGFYLSNILAVVMEAGVIKTTAYAYTPATVFSIQRRGDVVSYYMGDALIYTSETPTDVPLFADVSLYAGGDAITSAAIVESVYGLSGVNAVFEPLRSYAYTGTYAESAGVFEPIITVSAGHAKVVVTGVMSPLTSISSNFSYASSAASFASITSDSGGGFIIPDYALSANAIAYVLSYSHGLTGEIGGVDAAFEAIETLAANRPYGESRGRMSAVLSYSGEYFPINAAAVLVGPKGVIRAQGTEQQKNAFQGVSKEGSLTAHAGGFAQLTAGDPQLLATGVGMVVGRARLRASAGVLTASGQTGGVGKARLVATGSGSVTGYSGAVLSVRIGGQSKIVASGTAGSVGQAIMRLPLCRLVASGHTEDYGSAVLVGPALRPVSSGQARLINPSYKLVAYGTAVVAVSYEAYAVNLKHAADVPDAVTHYTNYPFTQIVRYQNSYYGVAADGLYLLEGTADAGVAIPFAVKTAISDFGVFENKTVSAAYFAGHIGKSMAVTLYAGDSSQESYAFTTPRGQAVQNHRQKFGRGVKNRYYALGVTGNDVMVLDSIELDIQKLTRRI